MIKGLSLVSGVIFLAVTITITAIVYQASVPVVQKMQDTASVEKIKDSFARLDEVIRQVAAEGEGSKRTVSMQIDTGKMNVNRTDDFISWELETEAPIFSPRTYQKYGNLVMGSNLNSDARPVNFTRGASQIEAYLLENEHLRVYVKQIGSESNHTSFSTSDIILGIYNKDNGQWMMDESFFRITLDSDPDSSSGTGFTKLIDEGVNLPYGEVMTFMNSSYISYYINITLESGTDFVIISASL